jgi:hypothetical protein
MFETSGITCPAAGTPDNEVIVRIAAQRKDLRDRNGAEDSIGIIRII